MRYTIPNKFPLNTVKERVKTKAASVQILTYANKFRFLTRHLKFLNDSITIILTKRSLPTNNDI